MVAKKKKKNKPKGAGAEGLVNEEAADEMLALESIYGDVDFTRDADGRGFSLRCSAHEGAGSFGAGSKRASKAGATAAAASALLCVRFPLLYPSRPLKVTVKPLDGLPEGAARALQRQLTTLAEEAARVGGGGGGEGDDEEEEEEEIEFDVPDSAEARAKKQKRNGSGGEVCAFSLATAAADFLADATLARPPPPPPDASGGADGDSEASAVVASLWDDAMRRTAELAAAVGGGTGAEDDLDDGGFALGWAGGGGLFGDAGEAAATALRQQQRRGGGGGSGARSATPPAPSALASAARRVAPAPKSAPSKPPPPSKAPPPPPPAASPPPAPATAAGERSVSAAIFRSVRHSLSALSLGGRLSQQKEPQQQQEGAGEGEEKREKEQKTATTAATTTATAATTAATAASTTATTGEPNSEAMQDLRKNLVLLQALRLAGSAPPSSPPPALLASELVERGLLPAWAPGVLAGPPAALDLALARAFGKGAPSPAPAAAAERAAGGGGLEAFLNASPAEATAARPDPPPTTPPPRQQRQQALKSFSRYAQDFQELSVLGRGGFGVVVSAANLLDGRRYAIKKIPLRAGAPPAEAARILREVSTLSRLQHAHVVRYFNCWIEDAGEEVRKKKDEKKGKETGKKKEREHWLDSSTAAPRALPSTKSEDESTSTPGAGFWRKPKGGSTAETEAETGTTETGTTETTTAATTTVAETETATETAATTTVAETEPTPPTDDDDESALSSSSPSSASSSSFSSSPLSSSSPDDDERGKKQRRRRGGRRQTLFIQMELCPRTLRDALDAGGSSGRRGRGGAGTQPPLDGERSWKAVRGLLKGLAYLHASGIIHRDIKPTNLFMSSRAPDAVLIGDFGLSKSAAASGDPASADGGTRATTTVVDADASDATGAVGTALYIAPELLQGWGTYDERIDVWSCGVVAFEVFNGPFETAMGRVAALRALRDRGGPPPPGEWPSAEREAELGGPAAADAARRLVEWMLARNPADRPTAADVLRSDLLPPELEDEAAEALLRSLPDSEELSSRVIDALFAAAPAATARGVGAGGDGKKGGGGGGNPFSSEDFAGSPTFVPSFASPSSHQFLAGIAASSNPGKFSAAGVSNPLTSAVRGAWRLRGAQAMSSSALGYCPPSLPGDAATMLSPSGALLALRYEFRRPFCEWLARASSGRSGNYDYFGLGGGGSNSSYLSLPTSSATPLLRFELGAVARRGVGRGLPRAHVQADYDVITAPAETSAAGAAGATAGGGAADDASASSASASADAEVVMATVDAISAAFSVVGFSAAGQEATAASSSSASTAEAGAASSSSLLPPSLQPPPWPPGLEVRLGHPALLRSCLFHAGVVSRDKFPAVVAALSAVLSRAPGDSRGRAAAWPPARAALAGAAGLSERSAAQLRRFALAVPGEASSALVRVAAELGCDVAGGGGNAGGGNKPKQKASTVAHPATRPLAELAATRRALLAAGAPPERVVLDPLLAPSAEYFSGVVFSVHAPASAAAPRTSSSSGGRRGSQRQRQKSGQPPLPPPPALIAVGGRYDALLRALWPKNSPSPGGCGSTINVGRLAALGEAAAAAGHHHHHHDSLVDPSGAPASLPLPTLDAVVSSRGGGGLVRERHAVASALRRAGLRAMPVPGATAPSARDAYALARASRASCLITIEAAQLTSAGTAKVKWLGSAGAGGEAPGGEGDEEEQVPLEDVAPAVASRLLGADSAAGGSGGLAAADDEEDEDGAASASAAAASSSLPSAAGGDYRRPRAWQRERAAARGGG